MEHRSRNEHARAQAANRSIRGALRTGGRLSAAAAASVALFAASATQSSFAAVEGAPATIEFNEQFLMRGGQKTVDVARFARGNPVMPGTYTVDLHVNDEWAGRVPVRFVAGADKNNAMPCIDDALLKRIAFNYEALTPEARQELSKVKAGGACLDLNRIAEGAKTTFDQGELRLDISVPQAVMLRNPRGYVSPELWTNGIPAATVGYNFNAYRSSGAGGASSTQSYLGLNIGAHAGGWHLRHTGSLSWQPDQERKYQASQTYVQHDIPQWQSQLTIGDLFTEGQLFEGVGIRGVQLSSDDRMLPDSRRGYAPVIRGVAQTNAKVTITQNGNKLHEITVPPGAFEINDLYATGSSGELVVTVTEADGRKTVSVVPYSTVIQLLRPDTSRYSLAVGKIRDGLKLRDASLVRGTYQRGFSNTLTGYAGLTAATGYTSALAGIGFDTRFGAMAADLTFANADLGAGKDKAGQSLRLTYSKIIPETNTSFSLAAYRYSSSGYWGLQDTLRARDLNARGSSEAAVARQRSQFSINVSQSLGDWGSVWATGSTQNYWGRSGADTQFQVGYSGHYKRLSYTVSAARQRNGMDGKLSNNLFFTLSMPLDTGKNSPSVSMQLSDSGNRGRSVQTRLSGTLGETSQLSYGAYAGSTAGQRSAGASVQYLTPYATINGSLGRGSGYSQASMGASGGMVIHGGGITLSNDLGDTIGLVEAPHATGATVVSSPGVKVDGRGYAVVPYLTPYRLNTVEIDPKGLPLDVQFQSTTQQSAPRANAVVLLKYETSVERSLLLETTTMDGSALPFGAAVRNEKGEEVGIVGQNGRIFVRGIDDAGTLTVVWGGKKTEQCSLAYKAPPRANDRSSFERLAVTCLPPGQRLVDQAGERLTSAKPLVAQ